MTTLHRIPVLVDGARTPIGRRNGLLAEYRAVELGSAAVRAALTRCDGLDPEYVALGNVVQAGNGQNPARIAAIRGGVDRRVPGITLNDVCLASMSAVGLVARMIKDAEITSGLVGGFESMSRAPSITSPGIGESVDLLINDGLWCALDGAGMGPIGDAENARLGISRKDQDAFAATSHRRAARATDAGRFRAETVGIELAGGSNDEGIRRDTSAQALSALAPAFTESGTITAGNASQMSDAGAAGVISTLDEAVALGHRPLVTIDGWATVAGTNSSLHLMPALAAKTMLGRKGMQPADIDLWEINEAFAGVVLASGGDLGLDLARVNVNGGAVALGHPLGASGFRLVYTLALEMRERGVEFGMAAICGGGGQGQAMLLRAL